MYTSCMGMNSWLNLILTIMHVAQLSNVIDEFSSLFLPLWCKLLFQVFPDPHKQITPIDTWSVTGPQTTCLLSKGINNIHWAALENKSVSLSCWVMILVNEPKVFLGDKELYCHIDVELGLRGTL